MLELGGFAETLNGLPKVRFLGRVQLVAWCDQCTNEQKENRTMSENNNVHTIDFSLTWETAVEYLLIAMESHAKKSYFKQDEDGESPRDVIRENLRCCGQVADLARRNMTV